MGCPTLGQGEPFSRLAGKFDVGRVLSVVPGEQLTASILGAVMSYVLSPEDGATRLLLKIVMERRNWYARALALGDWPIAGHTLVTETPDTSRDRRLATVPRDWPCAL